MCASAGVYGTTMRNTEKCNQGVYEVYPGYTLQDVVAATYLKANKFRNSATNTEIVTAITGGAQAIPIRYGLRDPIEHDSIIPSWLTPHSALALMATALALRNLPYPAMDIFATSAGTTTACAIAEMTCKWPGRQPRNLYDPDGANATSGEPIPTICNLVAIGGAVPPACINAVAALPCNAEVFWFTSNSDKIAATGNVMHELQTAMTQAGLSQSGPTIHNMRVHGEPSTMQELFGQNGHDVYRSWEAAVQHPCDYAPLPQGPFTTDDEGFVKAARLRAALPTGLGEYNVALAAAELIFKTVGDDK
jgi:hypothetical protein